ncbi:hypothetical protein TNCV_1493981 [Trichonephila clavipes]|nr:hypothetical protein TNCV_1493981 [Trichonephila clavipes]
MDFANGPCYATGTRHSLAPCVATHDRAPRRHFSRKQRSPIRRKSFPRLPPPYFHPSLVKSPENDIFLYFFYACFTVECHETLGEAICSCFCESY